MSGWQEIIIKDIKMAGIVIVSLLSFFFVFALVYIHANHHEIPELEKQKICVWISLRVIHNHKIDDLEIDHFIDQKFPKAFEKQRVSYRNYIKLQAGKHYSNDWIPEFSESFRYSGGKGNFLP